MYKKIVEQQRKEISKITLNQQKQILNLYDDAIKELSNSAARSRDKSLQKRWQLDYLKELERVRNTIDRELEKQIKDSTKKATQIGTKPEQQVMKDIFEKAGIDTGDHFTSMFSQVQDNIINDIVGGKLYKDNKTLSDRIWNYGNGFENDIQYTVSRAILEKKSAIELAKDLETYVKDPAKRGSDWGKVYPNLRSKQVDYNAIRMARTTINHSYQTATIQSSNMNPFVEGIEWRSALIHGRTCEICMDRDGKIYSKIEVPLDHPNGLCSMIPYIPDDLEDIAGKLRDWLDGADNLKLDEWYNNYGGFFTGETNVGKSMGIVLSGMKEKTAKENQKYRKTYNSTKEAFKAVRYTNIDKDYAEEIDNELLRVINKYPINSKGVTVKSLKKTGLLGERRFGFSSKNKVLQFTDELIYSNSHHKNKETSLKIHIKEYKRRGSKLAKANRPDLATIAHEYAHLIDNYYQFGKDKSFEKAIRGLHGQELTHDRAGTANRLLARLNSGNDKLSKEMYKDLQEEMGLRDRDYYMLIRKELGSYGAKNPDEFLAEGFSNMVMLENEDKTDFIKRFERMFEDKFDKVLR